VYIHDMVSGGGSKFRVRRPLDICAMTIYDFL